MRLLALLRPVAVDRLRAASGSEWVLQPVQNPKKFFDLAAMGSWDLLILDPEIVAFSDMTTLFYELSSMLVPVLIYTSLSSSSANLIARLANTTLKAVTLFGYDDEPEVFRRTLESAPLDQLGLQLAYRLGEKLDSMPNELRRGAFATICSSRPVTSAKMLASISRMTRRSVDRWFARVELRPSRWLVAGAQVLRAYSLVIQQPALPLAAVASTLQYGSIKSLQNDSIAFTRLRIREFAKTGTPDVLVGIINQALRVPEAT